MQFMSRQRAIIYGEVLFDVFPGEQSILGGAPFNVAWHLHGFGANPLFVSRIGADPLGDDVLARMQEWGMDCSAVQHDPQHATGMVQVALHDGQPQYEILEDVAYDHIAANDFAQILAQNPPALIYHGSLITRSSSAHASLMQLRQLAAAPVFVDINLRAPWHQPQQAMPLLQGCRWLKLNEEELQILSGEDCSSQAGAEQAARNMLQHFNLEFIVVTLGHRGAFSLTPESVTHTAAEATEDLVDTVGAGDALSSVLILGILRQWPLPTTLARGVEFAAAICRQAGATHNNPQLYNDFLRRWQ